MLAESGLGKDIVLNELNGIISKDTTYESGQPMASMSTIPHQIGVEVFVRTLEKNAGRLHTFAGSAEIEQEVILMIADLLNLQTPYGTTTSGGTESNILAMLSAREMAPRTKEAPEIVAPKTVHSSVDKAAWMLGIKLVKTNVDKQFKAKPKAIEKAISENTIGINTTAGTTYLGQIDPIAEIGEIARDYRLPLHVDAAFGGFVIPFLNELKLSAYRFDFSIKGVTSISTDPHKMGQAPIPSGTIIFRQRKHLKAVTRKVPYLPGASSHQSSILGTRPAASILATWTLLKHLGREGYRKIIAECMRKTNLVKERLDDIMMLRLPINPVMNIIAVQSKEKSLEQIVKEMELRGWKMAISPYPASLRIVVMPHNSEGQLNAMINDLEEIASTIPTF